MGQTPPPAMDEAFGQSDQVADVKPSIKEGLLHSLFAIHQGGPIDQAIAKAHQARVTEAQMHQRNMSTLAAQYHYGIDPKTGQPLTDEDKQRIVAEYNKTKELFQKAAGVDKATKAHAGAISQVFDHIFKRGAGAHHGPQGAPGQQGGLTPPPPDNMPTVMEGGVTPPKAGGGPTPPPQEGEQGLPFSATAPFERADIVRQQNLKDYTDREKVLYDLKTKEDEAKAKAQAEAKKATTGSARPATIAAISARKAKVLMLSGKKYKDIEGNDINVAELPDEMGLKSFTVKMPDGSWDIRYEPFSPNQRVVTAGNHTWAINPMDVEGLATDEGTFLGEHNVPATTATQSPETGLTTTATRTPASPGIPSRTAPAGGGPPRTPQGMAPATTGAVPQARKPSPPPTGPQGGAKAAPKPSAAKGADTVLDPDGKHISTNAVGQKWHAGVLTTPIIEAANQLIDQRDVDKIPAKVRELGAALAREKTGWSQHKFTPREMTMIQESSGFIDDLYKSDSLSVLDKGPLKRGQLSQVLVNPDKEGMIGRGASILSSTTMSKKDAEFIDLYNQAAQTVAGMGQLVRAGRMTQAMFDRLRADLPNPATVKDSKDAKRRLELLKKEIKIALQNEGDPDLLEGKGKGGPTPPPKSEGGSGKVEWTRDAQGNPVPVKAH